MAETDTSRVPDATRGWNWLTDLIERNRRERARREVTSRELRAREGGEIHAGNCHDDFFFFFLPLLDSGRLLIGEEKRGIKEIGRRKVYDLFTRVIRLH